MIKRILVGIDGSPKGDKAFSYALELARSFDSELHCCGVVAGPDIEMAEAKDLELLVVRQRKRINDHMSRLSATVGPDGPVPVVHVLEGHPVEQLLALAERHQVDHIVLGHRSKGMFERLLMGSVAKRVVDFARCSVTVVR